MTFLLGSTGIIGLKNIKDNLKEKRNTMGKDINLYFCCMKKFFYPLALAVTLLLTSCDVIDYHPYDTRVKGKHNLNITNIAQIEAICGK